MAVEVNVPGQTRLLRNRTLLTLMLAHFTVDTYPGLLPVLYPVLVGRFALSLQTVGFVALAFIGVSSLSQPFFGWLADRSGTRWIGLTLIWTAVMFAGIGFASSFAMILLLAAASGLGSGAFHPIGALNASAATPAKQRNTAMSIYVTGGTVGFALGPLIGVLLFSSFGLQGTLLTLLPGVIIGAGMLISMRSRPLTPRPTTQAGQHAPIPWLQMTAVIGVMMSRSWTIYSIESFVPTWYSSMGYSAGFYGALATTIVLASAVGAVGCGGLADRFGRKTVIIGALLLTIPAIILFAQYPGPTAFLTGALVGLSAASTGPLMLVMAQQLMVGRAGLASGLILGIGFVTGAIGVPITGMLADHFGIAIAIELQVVLVIATILLALLLPSEAKMRELALRSAPQPAGQRIASG